MKWWVATLVTVALVVVAMYHAYWLGRRSACRKLWHSGSVTFGEFVECMKGAPNWIERSTSDEVEEMARRMRR